MRRLVEMALTALMALIAIGAFALVFYVGYERLGFRSPAAQAVLGGIGLLIVLGDVWLTHRLFVKFRWPEEEADDGRRREEFAAEMARKTEELARNPKWERWAGLIRHRRVADEGIVVAWEARYRQLVADPKRREFAIEALVGNFPSNLEIDYRQDPGLLITCNHLRPIEQALRGMGMVCWTLAERHIATLTRLNFEDLKQTFQLDDCVAWVAGEPHPHAPCEEKLYCRCCDSSIESGNGERFPDNV